MTRSWLLVVAVLLVAACKLGPSYEFDDIEGNYTLQFVNGVSMPYTEPAGADTRSIEGGLATITPRGRYGFSLSPYLVTDTADLWMTWDALVTSDGGYVTRHASDTLGFLSDDLAEYRGVLKGRTLTVTNFGYTFVFEWQHEYKGWWP